MGSATNPVDILGLRGHGDAFACVDRNGRLFRSGVPCPEQDGCWDRDGGNDPNSKATVSGLDFQGEYQESVDYCSLNNQLVESCRGEVCVLWEGGCAALEGGPRITAGTFNCPNDCIDGACR